MTGERLFAVFLATNFVVSLLAQQYLFVGQVLGRGFPKSPELVVFERCDQVTLACLFQLAQLVVVVGHLRAATFGVAQWQALQRIAVVAVVASGVLALPFGFQQVALIGVGIGVLALCVAGRADGRGFAVVIERRTLYVINVDLVGLGGTRGAVVVGEGALRSGAGFYQRGVALVGVGFLLQTSLQRLQPVETIVTPLPGQGGLNTFAPLDQQLFGQWGSTVQRELAEHCRLVGPFGAGHAAFGVVGVLVDSSDRAAVSFEGVIVADAAAKAVVA
ncbi:hypothetical protein D3C81_1395430 [compost metagenome]